MWRSVAAVIFVVSVFGVAAEPEPLPLDDLASRYSTPKEIARFLRKEFSFKRDLELFGEIERWQTPDEFLARRQGDCEDYALLARELLLRNGYEAYAFSLFSEDGYAHTVCAYRDRKGRYNIINQASLRKYRAKSLEALAHQMHPGWSFGGIVDRDAGQGRLLWEIVNPAPGPAMPFESMASF